MGTFIKGMELCEGFFRETAEGILAKYFPSLVYSAGLLGYGSDVLGYDDPVSTDHMWGPRFYLFLPDLTQRDEIWETLRDHLPYTYRGYSVNFTEPDPDDNGVRHPAEITEGRVNPLIFLMTFEDFLTEQLGRADIGSLTSIDWLTISEHRLLSLTAGRFFTDRLGLAGTVEKLRYYPEDVRTYLIASNWDIIASEQAFVKRCSDVGDEIGSRILCARIAERLMRLCFLYKRTYAPYSKWFGTAFRHLDVDEGLKAAIAAAVSAEDPGKREEMLVKAQAMTAALHNESGITEPVEVKIRSYYGREIQVIFADRFSAAAREKLRGSELYDLPLIGSFSQMGGLSEFSDDPACFPQIGQIYRNTKSC